MQHIKRIVFSIILTVTLSPLTGLAKQAGFNTHVYNGSVKTNLTRILQKQAHWRVIWKAPVDYQWIGNQRLQGEDVFAVTEQIITQLPLQAVFYQGNKVVVIQARTL